jgi:hypothetical protein
MLPGMDPLTLRHADLIALVHQQQTIIAGQQARIAALEATIAQLEQRLRSLERDDGPPRGMPGHKREQAPAPVQRPPRRQRAQHPVRRRSAPTRRVVHAVERCPVCGIPLAGGSVKRTRAVIDLPMAPAEISAQVYLERGCPGCRGRWTPAVELVGEVVGRSRLGVGLVSLLATLRAELRLPVQAIQQYLASLHGLHLSVGGIVGALRQVARAGAGVVEHIRDEVRASP